MKFRYAMVCSSNQNRSMEAHFLLKRQGFDVSSYGTGAHVKLPGPSLREPNVYDFGTPYKHMIEDLRRKDPDLYPLLSFCFSSTLLLSLLKNQTRNSWACFQWKKLQSFRFNNSLLQAVLVAILLLFFQFCGCTLICVFFMNFI